MAFEYVPDQAFREECNPIGMGDAGEFTVKFREPTVEGHARVVLAGLFGSADGRGECRMGAITGASIPVAVAECVQGWDGVNGPDGSPIPFRPEHLLAIVRRGGAGPMTDLMIGLNRAMSGFPPRRARAAVKPDEPAGEGAGDPDEPDDAEKNSGAPS